jgi:glycosyltransferase involved in cell wall biosynthesis
MNISIIIPCRNEERHISQVLEAVLSQELEPDWDLEIVVADGFSSDNTRAILRYYGSLNPRVRLIDNPGRIVSSGLNEAIKACNGEIIIRMDAHTTYATDYVRQCISVLKTSAADNVGGPWIAKGQGMIGKAIAAAFQSRFCMGGGKAHDPHYEGEVDTVYLGCWPRSVFNKAGMFDPELIRNQDDEFNFRLRRSGGKIWQSPRIKSVYTPRSSFRTLFKQYIQYGFWKVSVIRKHGAPASWRHVVPAIFVGSALIMLLLVMVALLFGEEKLAGSIGVILVLEITAYIFSCLVAAATFIRQLDLPILTLLPLVFATCHSAYGLGFIGGTLATIMPKRWSGLPKKRFFTELTR